MKKHKQLTKLDFNLSDKLEKILTDDMMSVVWNRIYHGTRVQLQCQHLVRNYVHVAVIESYCGGFYG